MANQIKSNEDNQCVAETTPKIINYTRTQLLVFGQSKASKELPKVFDLSGADEKRKEKLRNVLKYTHFSQTFYRKPSAHQYPFADADLDNADAKSDEPEWANCGPISKHDIIELHGFDGPEDDGMDIKRDNVSPPARSTPSKHGYGTEKVHKTGDHFNFEEFLKLEMPASVNGSRDQGAAATVGVGKSRFTQWFGYDKAKQQAPKHYTNSNAYDTKSTPQQFFDYHQKANQKKMNAPNKFRSVDELEANWQTGKAKAKGAAADKNAAVDAAIRTILAQLAQSRPSPTTAAAQPNNFLSHLMNKNGNSFQHRMLQNAQMERPDAQLLLHRLVNGEITQFHILQQIGNPALHQRDRDTLMGVFKFCNENQQWLRQQQEQQLKQKQQMSLRLFQILQMNNQSTLMQTPLQANATAQAFIQNAMYKKQFEDLQLLKNNPPPKFNKFQPYKGGQQNSWSNFNNNRGYYQKS